MHQRTPFKEHEMCGGNNRFLLQNMPWKFFCNIKLWNVQVFNNVKSDNLLWAYVGTCIGKKIINLHYLLNLSNLYFILT